MSFKKIVVPFLIFLSIECHGQSNITRNGDMVCMPVDTYRNIRHQILLCDTLEAQTDSLLLIQSTRLRGKDSITFLLIKKIELQDSLLQHKNATIREMNENFRNTLQAYKTDTQRPFFHTKPFWIGISIGSVATILLLK